MSQQTVVFPKANGSKGMTVRQAENEAEAKYHVADAKLGAIKVSSAPKVQGERAKLMAQKREALREYLGQDEAVRDTIITALQSGALKVYPAQYSTGTLGWSIMGNNLPYTIGDNTFGLNVSTMIQIQGTKGTPQIGPDVPPAKSNTK